MVPDMKVIGDKITSRAKDNTVGLMEEAIMEAGRKTSCMAMVYTNGLMAGCTKESISETKNKVKGGLDQLMEMCMKGHGLKTNCMELEK